MFIQLSLRSSSCVTQWRDKLLLGEFVLLQAGACKAGALPSWSLVTRLNLLRQVVYILM
jgi:hypothetical protein